MKSKINFLEKKKKKSNSDLKMEAIQSLLFKRIF